MRLTAAIAVCLAVSTGVVGVQGPTTVARAPERFTMRVVASGFASPWEIAWGPDGQLWVTERESFRVADFSAYYRKIKADFEARVGKKRRR